MKYGNLKIKIKIDDYRIVIDDVPIEQVMDFDYQGCKIPEEIWRKKSRRER